MQRTGAQKKRMKEMDLDAGQDCGKRVMDKQCVRGSEAGHERLNWPEEKGETPLWGSTVTPAERFTPSTK